MNRDSRKRTGRRWPRAFLASVAGCVLGVSGCADTQHTKIDDDARAAAATSKSKDSWYDTTSYFKPDVPPPPAEIMTLRAAGFETEKPPAPNSAEAELTGAHDLYRRGDYESAERLFHYHAEKPANTASVRAEARYYEAECLRLQGKYPKAADTYIDLLNKNQSSPYREPALQHAFDIANFWLEDTRQEMKEAQEKRDGKHEWAWPRFMHLEDKKPFLGEQDRAIETLEKVRYNDINGPLADKALFLCGCVKFFNEDFREADFYFTQIYEKHKNSPLAPQAIELAIISKNLGTGGPLYDSRKVVEARKLVQAALDSYPELAGDPQKRKFLNQQMLGCLMQQAEKDYLMAQFWRRTGHAGSAYWYYGLVIQRYPGTDFAKKAAVEMAEIKEKVEKENAAKPAVPKLPTDNTTPAPPAQLPGSASLTGRQ